MEDSSLATLTFGKALDVGLLFGSFTLRFAVGLGFRRFLLPFARLGTTRRPYFTIFFLE